MTNKEDTQATIAELMAEDNALEQAESPLFKKPEVVRNELAGECKPKEIIKIRERLRGLNMLIPGSKLDPSYHDEYRRIKRPLLSNAFGKTAQLVENGNLMLVTSAIPGEGKTHSAINLALSIAQERDHTVLLVDCDVTRHGTSKMLGVSDKPGMVELLEAKHMSVGEVLLATDIEGLCLLPAGKPHDYVSELLSSQRMQEIVEEIGTRYDDRIIIFDSPPLLPTPQAQILTGLVGQIIFVVEIGKTPQSVVTEALKLIPEGSATGLLMNKSEGLSARNSYYYGYYDSEQAG